MLDLYIYKQRTQQNKNFVAFEGDICYNIVKISDFMMSHDEQICSVLQYVFTWSSILFIMDSVLFHQELYL